MEPLDSLRFALNDRINDAEVGPSYVPLSLLGQFRGEVEDFLKGSKKDVDPGQVIVSIEDGSLAIVASGLLAATSLWADLVRLQNPSELGSLDPKRAAVVERWQASARKNPHRSYVVADKNKAVTIRVDSASDFRNQVESVWMPTEKFLSGTVMDMGGTIRPNIHLKVDTGQTFTIAATQELISGEERNRVYKPALLRVAAEENLRTGELRNLTLLAFDANQPRWDEAAFASLVKKGTEVWADVPDNWLEELRGGHG
ncbi:MULTISPECIES: hypothetical protein [unclassified Xanthomonas]|uniref:hypothetical protein n=1 Tax=Xanthomonas sp. LMG 9002 TaxID=1591158 RepID=UPI00136D5346|nr:hypothetical protein [Xanthomonas sp. LMG 9002]MXV06518.1 hypothetical protein [Xanthomonas sp. LMG 9002]